MALAAVVVLSTVAPSAAAAGLGSSPATATPAAPADTLPNAAGATDGPSVDATDRAEVAPALRDANGTETVVVNLGAGDSAVRPASAATTEAAVDSLKQHADATQQVVLDYAASTDGVRVLNRFWLANAVLVEVNAASVDLAELAALDGVESVHPNFEVQAPEPVQRTAAGAAADYNTTYGLDQVNATGAWEQFDTRGDGVKVAVLDTGVSVDHPDIGLYTENPHDPTYPGGWAEFDTKGDRVEGSEPHAAHYHGTHTSGTVSGGNASGTYIGVAPNVSLMHGLVIGKSGGTFARIVAGMEWAVSEDADVVSMSLGAPGYHPQFIEPVQNARAAGVFVVTSSGNNELGTSGSPGNLPSSLSLSVGASDEDRDIAAFSSGETVDTSQAWGDDAPAGWPDTYVVPDVAAPGVDVVSAVPAGTFPDQPDAKYGVVSGTSMAAPHVAGVLALMVAASGGSADVAALRTGLVDSATKPPDAPDGEDPRYGHGIVDAVEATDTVAVDGAVTGTVTTPDGSPVADATVTVAGGLTVETNASGGYAVTAAPGDHEVTAGGFGVASTTTTVTVPTGGTAVQNLTVARTLAVEQGTTQPSDLESGTATSVTFHVANADSLTVSLDTGYDAANASLSVNGERATFGETHTFDDTYSGAVTVTVETADDTSGRLALTHAFAGENETATVTTGPTDVFAEPVRIAVVDSPAGYQYGEEIATSLNDHLPVEYEPTVVYGLANATERVDEFEAFVVQNVSAGPAAVQAFDAATSTPDVGVVYLDQVGHVSNGVSKLMAATGNPDRIHPFALSSKSLVGQADGPPVFTEDVRTRGGLFPVNPQALAQLPEGYDGGESVLTVGNNGLLSPIVPRGTGMTVDDLTRTVLAGAFGYNPAVNGETYYDGPEQMLANAVRWSTRGGPVAVADGQPDKVEPGETVTATFDVSNLTEYAVSVDDQHSTLTESELSLTVEGKVAAWGQGLAYDSRDDDSFTVTVAVDENATGTLSLDHEFVADGTTVNGSTGDTSVYEGPIVVPEDVETLQGAVDLAVADTTILLQDGTYDAVEVLSGPANENLTVRPAAGANATIRPAGPSGANDVVEVGADGFTLRDVRIESPREAVRIGHDASHVVSGGYVIRNTTLRNLTLVGYGDDGGHSLGAGITVGGPDHTADTTIENVSIRDFGSGISVYHSPRTVVRNVTITDVVNRGIQITYTNDSVIADNTIENVSANWAEHPASRSGSFGYGIELSDWNYNVSVVNNSVDDAFVGIDVVTSGLNRTVAYNEVTNASLGIRARARHAALAFTYESETTVVHNDVQAGTGVHVGHRWTNWYEYNYQGDWIAPDDVHLRYNDLSQTGVAVNNTLKGRFDARLNDYGERGPADGGAVSHHGESFPEDCMPEYHASGCDWPPTEHPDPGETLVRGNVLADPFLTGDHETYDVPAAETTRFATSLHVAAGETYTLGVPGAASGTLADVLGEEFQGAAYGYDEASQSWTMLTGDAELDALSAITVVPTSDTQAVVSFHRPGDAPATPGQRELVEGWNFVAAPAYAGAEDAFGQTTTEPMILDAFASQPDGQFGPRGDAPHMYQFTGVSGTGPAVSPFSGYFVFAESDGTMPAYVVGDPTVDELFETLGVNTTVETNPTEPNGDGEDVPVSDSAPWRAAAVDAALTAATERLDANASVEAAATAAARAAARAAPGANPDLRAAVRDAVLRAESGAVTLQAAVVEAVVPAAGPADSVGDGDTGADAPAATTHATQSLHAAA